MKLIFLSCSAVVDIGDSSASATSFESILSLVVLRSTKKIKATTSGSVLVLTSQHGSPQTSLFTDVNQSSSKIFAKK